LGCVINAHDSGEHILAPEFLGSQDRGGSSGEWHLDSPLGDGECARVHFIAQMLDGVAGLAVVERTQEGPEDGVAVFFAEGGTVLGFAEAGEPSAA
jgi:hypothetical protein